MTHTKNIFNTKTWAQLALAAFILSSHQATAMNAQCLEQLKQKTPGIEDIKLIKSFSVENKNYALGLARVGSEALGSANFLLWEASQQGCRPLEAETTFQASMKHTAESLNVPLEVIRQAALAELEFTIDNDKAAAARLLQARLELGKRNPEQAKNPDFIFINQALEKMTDE